MMIFVAGIHGVGKTFLAKPAAQALGLRYATASQLIREERGRATWDGGKFVDEVAKNQVALVAAVARFRNAGEQLLLDGHFVLRTAVGKHERLPEAVFRDLSLRTVVMLRCNPSTVLGRLAVRGDNSWTKSELVQFDDAEHDHARSVCRSLNIELVVLSEPEPNAFISAVRRMLG